MRVPSSLWRADSIVPAETLLPTRDSQASLDDGQASFTPASRLPLWPGVAPVISTEATLSELVEAVAQTSLKTGPAIGPGTTVGRWAGNR
jgi:hypothetical protein